MTGMNQLPQPLTAEEEREMIQRMKQGDKAARDSLIEHHLRLVWKVVHSFRNAWQDPEEMFAVGVIGLMKAIDNFNPDYGYRLYGLATVSIRNEILMDYRKRKRRQLEVSMDQTININENGDRLTLADILQTDADELDKQIMCEGDADDVRRAMAILCDRERRMIELLYGLNGKKLNQQATAQELGLSQSVISRLEKKTLAAMRAELNRAG